MSRANLILLALIACIAALPLFGGAYTLRLGTIACMYAIMALSWNVVGGFAGYPSFATAAFFGQRRPAATDRPDWTMRTGMALLALAAAGLGWVLAGRLGGLLQWPGEPEPDTLWRVVAIAAGILGLIFGAVGAWRSAEPALGPLPARLGAGLMAATEAPAMWTMRLAQLLDPVEIGLDKAARRIAAAAGALAGSARSTERNLDLEGRRAAGGIWRMALVTGRAEALGFGRGGDMLAVGIASGGERLRALQAGRLYLYTLALFVWAAAALVAGALMLWL